MKTRKKIAEVTGSRSEYGILKPLLKKIKNSKNLKLSLLVTGMHLLPKYGLTINEIKKDGFKIDEKIKMYQAKEKDLKYLGLGLGKGIENFTRALFKIKPDILLVFGDRLEPLAAVLAAATLKIPVAHIHGGDKTDSGHIDENIRHSISRFSHIHLAPTQKCKKRLIKMGEESWRVHNVGTLSIDGIIGKDIIDKDEFFKKINFNPKLKLIACLFHPLPLESEKMGEQMREIIKSLKQLKIQTVIIYPNNDTGSQDIINEIEKARNFPFISIFKNLSNQEYFSLLNYCDVLIGNSSSGIIEAPAVKLPVVNIGSRNVGREHAKNIIFVQPNKDKIAAAIKKALTNKEFKAIIQRCQNPYGSGGAAEKIIKILIKIKINKKLLQKKITY